MTSVSVTTVPRAQAAGRGASTPTRLRWLQLALVATCLLLGVSLAVAAATRVQQLQRAEDASELVAASQELRAALGSADAAAVNAFLAGGVDQPQQRARYGESLDAASVALLRAGGTGPGGDAADALTEVGRMLPVYSGLVETARANNRQQLALGGAYLRSASQLLRSDVAQQLDRLDAAGNASFREVDDSLVAGLGAGPWAAIVLAAAVLVAAHRWMLARTRRILNPGLLLTAVVLLAGIVWLAGAAMTSADRAALAITAGYDRLSALSAVRGDAYDHQALASFALVDRGGRESYNALAATAAGNVDARLEALDDADDLAGAWDRYRSASDEVTATDTGGDYTAARDLLTAPASDPATVSGAFATFDGAVADQVTAARDVLVTGLGDATDALDRIRLFGPIVGAIAALAAAWGIQQRINDYR